MLLTNEAVPLGTFWKQTLVLCFAFSYQHITGSCPLQIVHYVYPYFAVV